MRIVAMMTALMLIACASPAPPTPPAHSPLPLNFDGIPGPGDTSVTLEPHSPAGELAVGVSRNFVLGHCGLMSPVDIDGSLWDPVGGHDGAGGPLTEAQSGEMANSTQTVILLTDLNSIQMKTPKGAVIFWSRHAGPRAYLMCM
jgi:hypothetical protein